MRILNGLAARLRAIGGRWWRYEVQVLEPDGRWRRLYRSRWAIVADCLAEAHANLAQGRGLAGSWRVVDRDGRQRYCVEMRHEKAEGPQGP